MRINTLKPVYVKYIPRSLELGILYISLEFETAGHLCCCGTCGIETVTPLNRNMWTLTGDELVTIRPSIGNQNFPCKSHYWITNNRIEWL